MAQYTGKGGIRMAKYTYKFVEVPRLGLSARSGDTFEICKKTILEEAENGWRLKQIVTPFDEKAGVFTAKNYQIIFEKEA